jgi:hypothetical protein
MLFHMRGHARHDWCSIPIDKRSTTPTLRLALRIDMLRDVMTIVIYTTSSLLQAKRKSKGRCTVVLQYCLHALAPLRVYMRGDDQAFRPRVLVRFLSCDRSLSSQRTFLPLYIGYTALYWSSFIGLQILVPPLTGLRLYTAFPTPISTRSVVARLTTIYPFRFHLYSVPWIVCCHHLQTWFVSRLLWRSVLCCSTLCLRSLWVCQTMYGREGSTTRRPRWIGRRRSSIRSG